MSELCQSLEAEHRVIERVLGALEKESVRIEKGDPPNVALIERSISFVREFADGVHHQKEEQVLFPRMEQAGIPRQGGPIGVMLLEHEEGRRLVANMEKSLRSAGGQATGIPQSLVDAIRGYVDLLRGHIDKEDNILFPMADRLFADQRREEIESEFLAADKAEAATIREHRSWAESLD